MGSTVGAIFGALFNGWATAKWGYKPICIGGLFFLNAFIFIVFFAPTKAVLLVGQITCGGSGRSHMLLSELLTAIRSHLGNICHDRSGLCF